MKGCGWTDGEKAERGGRINVLNIAVHIIIILLEVWGEGRRRRKNQCFKYCCSHYNYLAGSVGRRQEEEEECFKYCCSHYDIIILQDICLHAPITSLLPRKHSPHSFSIIFLIP
jgi:hypothetical protein